MLFTSVHLYYPHTEDDSSMSRNVKVKSHRVKEWPLSICHVGRRIFDGVCNKNATVRRGLKQTAKNGGV